MLAGTDVATVQGPFADGAVNQTPLCSAYHEVPLTMMTAVPVLTTYCSGVPAMAWSCGVPPSKAGWSSLAESR